MAATRFPDSDSDEDLDMFVRYMDMVFPNPDKIILDRSNPFEDYNEMRFKERFRLNKTTVLHILAKIDGQLEYSSDRGYSIPPINQLLIALRFYATGTFHLVIADLFGVAKCTANWIIHRVTNILGMLALQFIKFPSTREERMTVMQTFFNSCNMPGMIGAIDCTHVPIHRSPGGDDAEIFRCRKGYFSVNVQLACDCYLTITDVVARWPGSVTDATIFDFSRLHAKFETGEITEGYLLGDAGYACRPYLITPLANPVTDPEKCYNEAHILGRNCIERTNGVLKR